MRALSLLPVLLLALLGSGCASRAPAPLMTPASAQGCAARWDLAAATPIWINAEAPLRQRFDEGSTCMSTSEGASSYASYRLPVFRQPYWIDIDSEVAGQTLFAPEVLLLDAAGEVVRTIDFERFSRRGERMRATVFLNPENREERYLVVRAARHAVGRTGEHTVTGSVIVPLINTVLPILVMYGTEYEQRYTLSQSGVVYLDARNTQAPRREKAQLEAARAQF